MTSLTLPNHKQVQLSEGHKKRLLQLELEQLQKANAFEWMLPHLFSHRFYPFALEYWESTNRLKFICSANQLGKSSLQIRHAIDLATDPTKWAEFFPKRIAAGETPQVFWYVYPDMGKVLEEFDTKWEPYFLPRGEMQHHPQFGWKKLRSNGQLTGIQFSTGVIILFKTWRMDAQASTIDAVFGDEEMPSENYPELAQRLNHWDGIFSMVFTATKGQAFWYDVIEKKGKGYEAGEALPQAAKWQVSLYDCQVFTDGTPSHFTDEEIEKRKSKCGSKREILKRVYGRFVSDEGLVFSSFERDINVKPPKEIPSHWLFYGGVDIGAGGTRKDGRRRHPPAIVIVAVCPDFNDGRVVQMWKGTDKNTYVSTDILNQYLEMTKKLDMSKSLYDWASSEFGQQAKRAGVPFEGADKDHGFGENLLNLLFKHEILTIDDVSGAGDLAVELENLKIDADKKHARDDLADALRYACTKIPWDIDSLIDNLEFKAKLKKQQYHQTKPTKPKRHARDLSPNDDEDNHNSEWSVEAEIEEYIQMLEEF